EPDNPTYLAAKEHMKYSIALPLSLRHIVSRSDLIDKVVSNHVSNYYENKERSKSAIQSVQVSNGFNAQMSLVEYAQNQRIIDQNDQIIKLLKQLVTKK